MSNCIMQGTYMLLLISLLISDNIRPQTGRQSWSEQDCRGNDMNTIDSTGAKQINEIIEFSFIVAESKIKRHD